MTAGEGVEHQGFRNYEGMSISNPAYWRRKLSAFLHDSPDKVIDLLDHEGRARSLAHVEGFALSEAARKESDHAASAADRLPWPRSKIGDEILCRSEFEATDKAFRHPLGHRTRSPLTPMIMATGPAGNSKGLRPLRQPDSSLA